MGLYDEVDEYMRKRITLALAEQPTSYQQAADSLGLTRRMFNYQMQRLGLSRQQVVQQAVVPFVQKVQQALAPKEVHPVYGVPINRYPSNMTEKPREPEVLQAVPVRKHRKIDVQVNVSVED